MKEPKKEFTKDFTKLKSMCTEIVIVMVALQVCHQILAPKLIELSPKTRH